MRHGRVPAALALILALTGPSAADPITAAQRATPSLGFGFRLDDEPNRTSFVLAAGGWLLGAAAPRRIGPRDGDVGHDELPPGRPARLPALAQDVVGPEEARSGSPFAPASTPRAGASGGSIAADEIRPGLLTVDRAADPESQPPLTGVTSNFGLPRPDFHDTAELPPLGASLEQSGGSSGVQELPDPNAFGSDLGPSVPEPPSLVLAATAVGLAAWAWRRRTPGG